MKNLDEAKKLSRNELRNIMGGTRVPPAGCSCFCYIGSVKESHSCTTYCPGDVFPGIDPGSPSNCGTPPPLN
jgi:natural product precursor